MAPATRVFFNLLEGSLLCIFVENVGGGKSERELPELQCEQQCQHSGQDEVLLLANAIDVRLLVALSSMWVRELYAELAVQARSQWVHGLVGSCFCSTSACVP